ncbi:hypothetical protein [Vulcanisaeta souniana]|nr:hypothetical protein [Vulcanisaeta souniana]BDR91780.1 hypothetical protein Vsou_08730 [Vulcanisaeta souniana JCM 11219]
MYSKFGFIDRPLNPSGVPPIERRYSPVGFEGELERVKTAINAFLKGSDNIAVVIVGQYGWGKSELLDAVEAAAQGLGLKVLRLPLSFGLDINVIINSLLKARSSPSEPLLLLIDEADEVSRAVELSNALSPSDAGKVRDLVIKLGSLIRALIEPRNYKDVFGIDPRRLSRVMVVLAFTPQLYYNILKNMVPDVFDITRGRVYMEVVLDERMPLWLYEAMLLQRFNAYSTDERLDLVKKGLINGLHPLRREYLATLYELVANTEGGKASPRALVKFTSKLLDVTVDKGRELNYEVFEEFLRSEVAGDELKAYLDVVNEGPDDERGSRVFRALLLSGFPRGINDLSSELGFDVTSYINALTKAGLVEEVQVARFRLDNNGLSRVNNELVRLGLAPIEGGLRDISISYGSYYTAYEGEPVVYVVFPSNAKVSSAVGITRAYQVSPRLHRILVFGKEPEEIIRAKEEVSRAISIVNAFREDLAMEVVKAAIDSQVMLYPESGAWFGVIENSLDARIGIIVGIDGEFDQFTKLLSKVVSEGVIPVNGQERIIDALLVVVLSRTQLTNDIVRSVVEPVSRLSWKLVLGPVTDFTYFSVFGSDRIDELRSIVIGSRLERLDRVPREYSVFLERLNDYRDEVLAFRDRVRQRVLQHTMAIRRGAKESKDAVIRRIVEAWVKGENLEDQPEVFRDDSGKARISTVELSFINYLRSLGKQNFTTKELEYLIRRLYPTHLWREFRESDLIKLLSLRGLLLPINDNLTEYAPYTPELVPQVLNVLDNYLNRLNETLYKPLSMSIDELKISIEVKPGFNIQGSDCERSLTVLKAVPETSSEFLKKYSLFMLCVDKLENEVEQKLGELNNELTSLSSTLNNTIRDIMNKLNAAKNIDEYLPGLSMEVESKINNLVERIKAYLMRISGLELDSIKESLPTILEAINSEANDLVNLVTTLRNIEDKIKEYMELTSVLSNASVITGIEITSMSINDFTNDLLPLVRLGSLNALSNYLNELMRVAESRRKELSDVLSNVNALIDKYAKITAWLKKRTNNKVVSKLLSDGVPEMPKPSPTFDNAKYIVDAIRGVNKVIESISKGLNIPRELLTKIASLGPNVGIDEEDIAKELNMDMSMINKYLESMWRAGLIDRKYVT